MTNQMREENDDKGIHIASDGSTTNPTTATTRNIRVKGKMDRLSSLPDSVIGHILSFLDTKSAVQTSILSRRWTYLYTFSTNLHFSKTGCAISSYIYGINRVMMRHKFNIKKFDLWMPSYDGDSGGSHVNSWIAAVVSRGVEELKLDLLYHCDLKYDWAPRCLFLSQTLVIFTLSNFGTFPRIPSSVWLPSLKILHMVGIQFLDSRSMTRLFNGCPLLEDLSLAWCKWENGQVYTIPLVMLRRLMITSFDSLYSIEYTVNFDVPRLEWFKCVGVYTRVYCIRSSSALAIAEITVFDDHEWDLVLSFIKSISNAMILKIFDRTVQLVLRNSVEVGISSSHRALHEPPIFDNLSHLEVTVKESQPSVVGWEILQHLLSNSPNLETLVLKNVSKHCNALSEFVRSPTFAWPPQLKVIQLHGFSGSAEEEEMVTLFLRKAIGLKQLNVNVAMG
ncbi:hypothetical protein Dimus_012554 [Dionaea muscipula]